MKKWIQQNKTLFLCLIIPYLFVIVSFFVPVSYDIITPATTSDLNNVFLVDDTSSLNTSFNSVSVYSYSHISLMDYLIGKINPYANISKSFQYYDTSSTSEYTSGSIQKQVSLTNSIICSYNVAKKAINYRFSGYVIHTIYKGSDSNFQLGDIVEEVEHKLLTPDFTMGDAIGYVEDGDGQKKVNLDLNKTYHFKVNRKGTSVEFDCSPKMFLINNEKYVLFGISFYEYYTILSSTPHYTIQMPDTIGPSAGFMQSLYLYALLTNYTSDKYKKIVGTGTITVDGKIGAIGGIEQKIIASNLAKADVFFAPDGKEGTSEHQNYLDALNQYNKLINPSFELIGVETIEDAINYLTSK